MTANGRRWAAGRLTDDFLQEAKEDILRALRADKFARNREEGSYERFAENLLLAAEMYFDTKAEPSLRDVRQSIRALNAAASIAIDQPPRYTIDNGSNEAIRYRRRLQDRFEKVQLCIRSLPASAVNLLVERRRTRPNNLACQINPRSLLPMAFDETTQVEFCAEIASLTQVGRHRVEGRLRPGGKRSRPTAAVDLYAPEKEQNIAWREADRELEMWLAVAWLELSGQPSQLDKPYVDFVSHVFEQLAIDDVDVAVLVREGRRRSIEGWDFQPVKGRLR